MYEKYFTANKEGWNKKTAIHKTSSFYDLEKFKKGETSLNKIELEELGNVNGKKLLHLQCHFGMDTLSWAREGATVTGIDISDEAINLAKDLATELSIPATFICCNVYYASTFVTENFYIADSHPTLWMYDNAMEKIEYSYFNDEVIETIQTGTYADRDAAIEYKEYGWNHPFSEILESLISEGLQIEFLHEFSYSPYNCFNNVEQGADGMWRFKGRGNKFPMLYSIKAVKI